MRDSQALLEAFDRLREPPGPTVQADAWSGLREHLARMRQEGAGADDDLADRLVPVREQWERAAERLASWTIRGEGFDALESGLMQVYRKARRATAPPPTTAAASTCTNGGNASSTTGTTPTCCAKSARGC